MEIVLIPFQMQLKYESNSLININKKKTRFKIYQQKLLLTMFFSDFTKGYETCTPPLKKKKSKYTQFET